MEDTAATLATELDGLLDMARELEARVDGDWGALAASVDRAMRHAGNGTLGGGDVDGSATGGANVSGQLRSGRKGAAGKVRVASVTGVGPLNDGLSWRKYGQRDILGAAYPRAYFRQTQGCAATKQVQRAAADPLLFDVVYQGAHTCCQAAEQQQSHAGFCQEQQSQPAVAPEGIQWPVTPPSFPSTPAGTVGDCYPSVCQIGGGYGAGGGLGADMGFGSQLDDWFLYLSEVFQPEVQNL